MFRILKPHIGKGALCADLGIGTGQLSALFKKKGAYVAGADVSAKMLETCRQAGRADELHQVDLNRQNLPFAKNRFDVVASCGMTEFINPLEHMAAEMARVAKPGGLIALTYEIPKGGRSFSRKHHIEGFDTYCYGAAYIARVFAAAGVQKLVDEHFTGYIRGANEAVTHGLFVGQVQKPGRG